MTAQFSIGQTLHLLKDLRALKSQREGLYTIVRVMPADGREPHYRIKHQAEAFERIVAESQLAEIERNRDEPAQVSNRTKA